MAKITLATLMTTSLLAVHVNTEPYEDARIPVIATVKQRLGLLDRRARRQRNVGRVQPIPVEPTPTPTPTYSAPTTYSSDGWADELLAVGFPESAIPTMLYIIDRESGGNPGAINSSSGACGLTQIYPYVAGCLDPMTNLRLAYQKYQASGFAPWSM